MSSRPHPAWKKFERRVCRVFGTERRGADKRQGCDDGQHEHYAIECKLLRNPRWSDLVAACKQAERNAQGREPVAVVKATGAHDGNALVVMRLDEFRKWRLQ